MLNNNNNNPPQKVSAYKLYVKNNETVLIFTVRVRDFELPNLKYIFFFFNFLFFQLHLKLRGGLQVENIQAVLLKE